MSFIGPDSRAEGAYLGLAVGDALGATVEFMTPREIQSRYGRHRDIVGGGWLNLKPGQVTDDTTMALALGDAVIADGGRVEAHSAACAFNAWMRGKPVDIGNTVRRGIMHFRTTGEAHVPADEQGAGNGACMRVLPVALVTLGATAEVVRESVLAQARVTHNHPLSDAGTLCVTAMVQAFMQGEDKYALLHGAVRPLIDAHPEFNFRRRRNENPSGFIVHTLQVVFEALIDTDDFESCLIEAVNRGGDADTTGAIAGMLAGAHYGRAAIPSRWIKALDPGVRTACTEQAAKLLALSSHAGRAG